MNRDPVHFITFEMSDPQNVSGWYFWDETWSDRYGPYQSESEARAKLKEYVETTGLAHD